MAYFPFFIDLEQKEGLIVGGGRVALGKARHLLPYGPRLTVAAPQLLPDFYELPDADLLERPFSPELLEGKFFVIAATGDVPLDRRISTGGASPSMAAWLRGEIEGLLPERTEEILEFLQDQRPRVKTSLPSETRRSELFRALFRACLEAGGPISQSEADAMLSAALNGEGAP